MGIVVQLADFRKSVSALQESTPLVGSQPLAEFTLRDRGELDAWATHGRRASLCSCELGAFAMLYEGDASWAFCGVVRQEELVLLWDCITLADIGWFPSMQDALRAVPTARRLVSIPQVLPFATTPRHCAVVG